MKVQRIVALLLFIPCLNAACFSRVWLPTILAAPPLAAPTVAGDPVSGSPVVRKIEPPNWWVNYTPELMLLLTGENLGGARVESPTLDVGVLGAEASANGHYLFVHLRLSSDLP